MTFVPTAEQQVAIDYPLTPLRLVAGAGTGKTSVMAAAHPRRRPQRRSGGRPRGARPHLHQQGRVEPQGEGAGRARAERRRHGRDVPLLRRVAGRRATRLELGLDRATQVLNRAQSWQLLFAVFDEFRFQRRATMAPQFILDDALALASRCADYLVPIERGHRRLRRGA